MSRAHYFYFFGALLVGLLVRIPGIFWGYNFPFGWYGHHVDEYVHLVNAEMLINPLLPPRWPPHPYPKGLAAHVAVPVLGMRLLEGKLLVPDATRLEKPPELKKIIVGGRVVSVLYGTATILIVFLLARALFRDPRIGIMAAWIVALGGLHVSQSHYFVSDVPGLFWLLVGLFLLFRQLETQDRNNFQFLLWAAFCFGVGFGIKLVIAGLPTLALIAVMHPPRVVRAIHAAVFFLVGIVVVNIGSYTPVDFYKTVVRGISDPYHFSRLSSLLLYLIELPSIVSLPLLLLAMGGIYFLARKLFLPHLHARLQPIVLIVILPVLIDLVLVVFKLDHFPRHIIPFVPWIALAAAWSLIQIADKVRARGVHPGFIILPLLAYLAIFVYDGEKAFIKEPRNEAARWLLRNVAPGTAISWDGHDWIKDYEHVPFPDRGRPPVVVIEMHSANHYLSDMSWKNSYPRDYRYIFASRSQARVDALQSLFKGTSEYREVARFSEGYFMPEHSVVDRLIGNRSRNYVAEIVIFKKTREPDRMLAGPAHTVN